MTNITESLVETVTCYVFVCHNAVMWETRVVIFTGAEYKKLFILFTGAAFAPVKDVLSFGKPYLHVSNFYDGRHAGSRHNTVF